MPETSLEAVQRLLPARYRVEREIARGGMSRVYLARESHPDRLVAIKVMDRKLSEEGRKRFLQEVDFTSKLSHPHIVPIFTAGEAGESLFYVMPFIEGETLADRIRRGGALPIEEALEIAQDVARALHYAHGKGVIHRDIKPGNILFQDDHALVADFGIARARGDAGARMTREGHTLGTVEYMAPEQAAGATPVDGRTDQYSLGCILYEMLAGEPPFQGKTAQSTLARHLSESVPPLRAFRPAVSEEVAAVVARSLQKTPADRFESLADFGAALRRAAEAGDRSPGSAFRSDRDSATKRSRMTPWIKLGVPAATLVALALVFSPWTNREPGALAGSVYRTSVAVLPPEGRVLGPAPILDPDDLAEGLAAEVSTALSRVPWVKVTPPYSVRVVRDANLSVPRLLDTLGVEHLIQGSLIVQGDRISVRMGHVDSEDRLEPGVQREVALGDWLDVQPEIAQEVARHFVSRFEGNETTPLGAPPTPGSGQWDFLNGNRFLGQRTPDGVRLAIQSYWRAIESDSLYGPAYAKLSSAYALALTYRYAIGVEEYEAAGLAEVLATRAIELSPNAADGYASRSYVRALAGAPTDLAAADIERARRLEPNNASVPSWSARVHSLQGNFEEALREAIRAAELDPLQSGRQIAVAYQSFHMGRHELAVEYSDIALELEPGLMLPRVIRARALMLLGRSDECLAMELGPHSGTRALCLWASGDRDRAEALADSLEASYGPEPVGDFTPVVVAEDLAAFYGFTGRPGQALRWIEIAYDRSPTGVELRVLESDLFDRVRDDPGFHTGVDRMREALWGRVQAAWQGSPTPPVGG